MAAQTLTQQKAPSFPAKTGDAGRTVYLFRRAQSYKARGDEDAFRKYHGQFMDEAAAVLADPAMTSEMAALLYKAGEHDRVLELFAGANGVFADDTLPTLACAVYFARQEPHNALAAAKHIRDAEQRRLRQKTAELWQRLHHPLPEEPRVHLIILTYNREEHVTRALRELAATDYSNYAVFIADNGSTDATLARAREAATFFPPHVPVSIEALPTNLGRPVGHNWLLTAHDHSAAQYIAIGDDDLISVPKDWLRRMIQTAKALPGCACVGGKALTPGCPRTIHGGVRNFTQFGPDCVDLTNSAEQDDLGQFDFVDIVDHVIGCLHIFDKRALDKTGLFDIRFSPCQMVDIEHHLRMRLAGDNIVFNGLISFEHLRAMGVEAGRSRVTLGNSLGNMLKILYKYDHEETRQGIIRAHQTRNDWLMG